MTDSESLLTQGPPGSAGGQDIDPSMEAAAQTVRIDALPIPAAQVDREGVVLQANEPWRLDAPGLEALTRAAIGVNLLERCRSDGSMLGRTLTDGIQSVLRGSRPGFCHEYVSRTASDSRRFMVMVSRADVPEGGAALFLFDVSDKQTATMKSDGVDWVFRQCLSDVFVFDGQSLRFMQVSESLLDNLGYSNDQILAMTIVDVETNATVESFHDRLERMRSGVRPTLEWVTEFRRRDGTTYPVEIHLERVEANGTSVYFAIAMDLTRGTATEQVLKQAEVVLETTPDAMLIVDDHGLIRVANTRMANLFGYTASELNGMEVDALLPPRLRATHSLHPDIMGRRPGRHGLGANLSLAALTKSGDELAVEVIVNPVTTRDGTLVAAVIRDLSDVERTQRALRESEERYSDLFENASDVIQIIATDGKLIYVNPAWRRVLGYSKDDARTMSVYDMLDEQQTDTVHAMFGRLLAGLPLEDVAWRLKNASGNLVEFEGSVDCQRSNGHILGFRAILHDVTHRNAYEAALRDARRRAENSAATKSRFLAAAGHDLRQPLQSLGLYLSVLSRRVEDPLVEEIGRKMRISVDAMASLLDALLDISRFDAGMIVPRRRDFALAGLLKRIVTDNVQQAERKGLTLTCCSGEHVIYSDPALLERIVENFVTNAIRYTDSGNIEIGSDRCDDDVLRIWVKDTGIGIAGDQVEHIFDEYFQVDNPARERGRGLGLGLSIVKHVARLLDLPTHVSSTPGIGSVFSIDVPLGDAGSVEEAQRRLQERRATSGGPRPVVMVVDDDVSIVDASSMFLDVAGYEVTTAQSLEQVESILDAGAVPDVLVTDYLLPDVSGIELVRRVRHRLDRSIPAVLITGDTSVTDQGADQLPDSWMMRKPVKTDALLALIDSLIAD